MLRVTYTNPIGYLMVPACNSEEEVRVELCQANVKLWAEIYHCTDDEGKPVHQLMGFFMDNSHLERCLNSMPQLLKYHHYYFNSYYTNCTAKTYQLLCRMGAKVTIYYEEPKEPCQE